VSRAGTADKRAPLQSVGHAGHRRSCYAGGIVPDVETKPMPADARQLEAKLVGAALRYVAVADWFEQLPASRHALDHERRAMDTFGRIEAELRQAGGCLLRRLGHRQLVLERALEEVTAS